MKHSQRSFSDILQPFLALSVWQRRSFLIPKFQNCTCCKIYQADPTCRSSPFFPGLMHWFPTNTGSCVGKVDLKLHTQPKKILNFCFSCLHLQSAGITGRHHRVYSVVGMNPGLRAKKASNVPTELHPSPGFSSFLTTSNLWMCSQRLWEYGLILKKEYGCNLQRWQWQHRQDWKLTSKQTKFISLVLYFE